MVYCLTRFAFFILMFAIMVIYLIIGLIEFYFLISNKSYSYYIKSKLFRKIFVGLFYFTAILYAIIHDIINETSSDENDNVHEECEEIDFLIPESAIFYSQKMENLFVFIMLLDLVLFGELFKSYKIVLDPFYWFSKVIWRATNKKSLAVMTLTLTILIFALFAFLFVKYDIGLF
eukprot:495045_1